MSTLPKLVFDNVSHTYPGKKTLHNISLTVNPQEVISILGPSGSGKSTLLKCVNGLEPVSGGRIDFNPSSSARGQSIGMVFQHYDLFPHLTVEGNLMLAPQKVLKRNKRDLLPEVHQLLERVGLLEYAKSYPRHLSGGQKQRVAIARALCMQPEVMLFDEVTASLDPELVREVLDVIRDLKKSGMTLLIVTHELKFARAISDRIVFMDQGKIVEISDTETFFTSPSSDRAKQFLKLSPTL